jgi:hypothetical protein
MMNPVVQKALDKVNQLRVAGGLKALDDFATGIPLTVRECSTAQALQPLDSEVEVWSCPLAYGQPIIRFRDYEIALAAALIWNLPLKLKDEYGWWELPLPLWMNEFECRFDNHEYEEYLAPASEVEKYFKGRLKLSD